MKLIQGNAVLFCILVFSFGKINAQEGYSIADLNLAQLENSNAVIRKRDLVFEIKSATETVFKVHQVVTLLNHRSQFDKLMLYYDGSSSIRKLSGRIYDAMGREIRKVKKDEIRDRSAISSFSIYEDNRVKYVDLALKQFPVTVEFEYEAVDRNELFIPGWDIQPYNTAVQSSTYTLITPEGFDVEFKAFNIQLDVEEEKVDGKIIRKWEVSDLPAIKQEPYAPPAIAVLPMLIFAPNEFYFHGYQGSWSTWDAFGAFMSELMAETRELPETVKQEVRRQLAGKETTAEKVEALYRFLQNNTRYVSVQIDVSGWQPYPAKDVAEKKYGDCKGLSNYMKALLEEAGIEAWPALIYSNSQPNVIPEDFVMPAFNHMVLYLPSENQWLECTSNTYPVGYAGWHNQNRKALLITEGGGRLVDTPPLKPADNFANHHTRIYLAEDGKAQFADSVRFGGWQHEWLRYAYHNMTRAQMQEEYLRSSSLPAANLAEFAVNVSEEEPSATVVIRGEFLKYAAKSGKRLFMPVNAVDVMSRIPEEMEDRKLPVWSHRAYADHDSITVILPKGYKIESSPAPVSIETPWGKYRMEVETGMEKVIIVRSLEVVPVHLPAAEYQQWRAFFKEVARADAAMIVLVQQKT